LQQGDVLVTEMTDPDWEPVMKRAAAVVTDRGGRTCHAAIVSRELGIPAIVGTATGTRRPSRRAMR
jgi:pyruvate, water dikinase